MVRTVSSDYGLKYDKILDIATQVFADKSFDGASMNNVAEACGTSKASLYHYFPSKNSILFAILNRNLRGLSEHILGIKKTNQSDEEFLVAVIEEILIYYQGNDDVHQLQIQALRRLKEEDQAVLIGYMRSLVSHMSSLISNVKPGHFDDPHKLRMATMSLFGMLNWYYTWSRGRGIKKRREYARYVAEIFIRGAYT